MLKSEKIKETARNSNFPGIWIITSISRSILSICETPSWVATTGSPRVNGPWAADTSEFWAPGIFDTGTGSPTGEVVGMASCSSPSPFGTLVASCSDDGMVVSAELFEEQNYVSRRQPTSNISC